MLGSRGVKAYYPVAPVVGVKLSAEFCMGERAVLLFLNVLYNLCCFDAMVVLP